MFKVGDIIVGNSKSDREYALTNSRATMKVTRIYPSGDIEVEIIDHLESSSYINNKFNVIPSFFTHKYKDKSGAVLAKVAVMERRFKMRKG